MEGNKDVYTSLLFIHGYLPERGSQAASARNNSISITAAEISEQWINASVICAMANNKATRVGEVGNLAGGKKGKGASAQ